jgi:predicted metal-dependent HD superfamily phosphohydrolase
VNPPDGLRLPPPLIEAIDGAYGAAGRAYHDRAHLAEVLRWFDVVAREVGWAHPREVWLALLFHDAAYLPGRSDNEEASARLARDAIERWLADASLEVGRVERLIRLTARHGHLSPDELDHETALFLDCDMAILGAGEAAFDAYDRGVQAEYAPVVPPAAFAAGRRRFLEGLLARPRIFLSDFFHARLDAAARANLRRRLGATPLT